MAIEKTIGLNDPRIPVAADLDDLHILSEKTGRMNRVPPSLFPELFGLDEYAKTGGSDKTVKEVEDEIVQLAGDVNYLTSINLLDSTFMIKDKLLKLDGSEAGASNFDVTDYIEVKEGDEIIYSGYTIANRACLVTYDSDKNMLSVPIIGGEYKKNIKVIIGSGVSYIRASSANELNPTSPATIVLLKALTANEIERIINETESRINELNVDVVIAEEKLDMLFDEYESRNTFNGLTSELTLPNTYILNDIGDYLEMDFEVKNIDTVNTAGYAIAGLSGETSDSFGASVSSWLVRGSDGIIKRFPDTKGLYLDRSIKRVEVTSSGWQLSINGEVVSTIDKGSSLSINNIGHAYPNAFTEMNVYYFKIHSATSGDIEGKDLTKIGNPVDIVHQYVKKNLSEMVYPKMMVELIPSTEIYTGIAYHQVVAKVYERLGNGKYACHMLYYSHLEYDDYSGSGSGFVGGRLVNHGGCVLATYDPITNEMIDSTTPLIIPLENEFLMNDGNWSSGVHGNEVADSIYFVVDGNIQNPDGDVLFESLPLTACSSFYYTQKSELHSDTDKSLLAEKFKISQFENGGYRISIKIKMKQSKTVSVYSALVCMSKYFTTLIPDFGDKIIPIGDDGYPLIGDKLIRSVKYCSSDIDGEVTSEINGNKDTDASTRIWDRAADTKYYRRYMDWTANTDDTFEVTTTVTFR